VSWLCAVKVEFARPYGDQQWLLRFDVLPDSAIDLLQIELAYLFNKLMLPVEWHVVKCQHGQSANNGGIAGVGKRITAEDLAFGAVQFGLANAVFDKVLL